MPKLNPRRALTKRKILAALKDYPDDHPIYVNVEFKDGENWDTWNAFFVDMSFMCPGFPGCTHTEPEMDWEMVLGIKFGEERGIMEPAFEDEDEDEDEGEDEAEDKQC
jgi:hypothetical protein